MSRRARIERENAADDLATAVCADRLQYATALARLAEEAASPRLALAANDGVLLARIRRLLVPKSQETNNGWATRRIDAWRTGLRDGCRARQSVESDRRRKQLRRRRSALCSRPLRRDRRPSRRKVRSSLRRAARMTFRKKMALGEAPQLLQSTIGARELSFDWFNDDDRRLDRGKGLSGADLLQANFLNRAGHFLVAQGEFVLRQTNITAPKVPEEPARGAAVDAKSWLEDAFQLEDKAKARGRDRRHSRGDDERECG